MNMRGFLSVASILVSAALLVVAAWVALVPRSVAMLPWAGALAGLLAVLQAGALEAIQPGLRWLLVLGGLATAALMVAVALLRVFP